MTALDRDIAISSPRDTRAYVEEADTALRPLADATRAGSRTVAAFPNVREAYRRAARAAQGLGGEDLAFVLLEADGITSTVNTLAPLLSQPLQPSVAPIDREALPCNTS
jgi:plasmid stabilization system protein ParE